MLLRLFTTHCDLRSAWSIYPIQTKLYLLLLIGEALYSTVSLFHIFFQMRILRDSEQNLSSESLLRSFSNRLANLRQLDALLALFFGLALTDDIFRILVSMSHAPMLLGGLSPADYAESGFTLASVSLLVLTFLHSLQWIVSARLNFFSQRHT
jgi:hypothetical protein